MKKTLSIIIFLILGITVNAQNWKAIHSDKISYFSSNNKIYAIKISSDETLQNGDIQLNSYENVLPVPRYSGSLNYQEYYSPSWLGRKVIVKPNGDYIFYSMGDNEAVLHTQNLFLGREWAFYTESDSAKIEARVFEKTIQNILGTTDSVIKIELNYLYDSKDFENLCAHKKDTLILSKNNGIVQSPNIYNQLFTKLYKSDSSKYEYDLNCSERLNIISTDKSSVGIKPIFNKDIYNFEVGDEFHNQINNGSNGVAYAYKEKKRCLIKNETSGSISYTFEVESESYNSRPGPNNEILIENYTKNKETVSESYANDDSDFFPFSGVHTASCAISNTQFTNKINNRRYTTKNVYATYQDCFNSGRTSTYYEGLGNATNLKYWKKGNETSGSQVVFLNSSNKFAIKSINIYPNPSSNKINFKLLSPGKLEIYDMMGRKVLVQNAVNGINSINVSELTNGIYNLSITTKNEVFYSKFIKE